MASQAELIITGARIYTVDSANPWASALAVADGRILAVGSDDEALSYRGDATVVRDADGAFVMPSFIDAHNHHALAGRADLYELSFSNTRPLSDVLAAVAEYAKDKGADEWIIGSSWGTGLIAELSTTKALHALDKAAGGRPVILVDDSHHNRWVSSRALELAGVTRDTPDPAAGRIVRDVEDGEPTGVMLEAAGILIEEAARKTHTLSATQHERSSARGIEIAHTFGITAFQDAAISLEAMAALKALDDRGELKSWVVTSMTVNDQIFGYAEIGDDLVWRGEEFRTKHHRPDFIKIFLDGTPPAFSGAFLHPYLPDETHGDHFHGETTMPQSELEDWLRRTAKKSISAKIHCSGDAAVRMVLDVVEKLRNEGFTDTLYHIAHGQFIDPADLPRFAKLGVTAEISPFLWFPGVIADALGTVRPANEVAGLQPNRSLIDSGALVAGGSDWPVSETPNAWEAIQGLVTRADPHGQRPGQLGPQEAISLEEAISVFTLNGAQAIGLADTVGSLEAGKSADFIVLDRDPFKTPQNQLVQTGVQETWFSGERVFSR